MAQGILRFYEVCIQMSNGIASFTDFHSFHNSAIPQLFNNKRNLKFSCSLKKNIFFLEKNNKYFRMGKTNRVQTR